MKRFYDNNGNLQILQEEEDILATKVSELFDTWISMGYNSKDFYQMLDFYAGLKDFDWQLNKDLGK